MDSEFVLGIDEAGMGPVFGPLVVSGVLLYKKDLENIRSAGVKDSKKFGSGLDAHRKRLKVWEEVEKFVLDSKDVVIDAETIDGSHMYELHLEATRAILNYLNWKTVSEIYVEQIGGLHKKNFFRKLGFSNDNFVYEPKADVRYVPVSLASISAKTTRDRIVIGMCREAGYEYISGYANKNTEDFLRDYFDRNGCLPPGTRISRKWAPIIELNERKTADEYFQPEIF